MKSRWIFGPDRIYYVTLWKRAYPIDKLETMTIEISGDSLSNRLDELKKKEISAEL